MKIVQLLPTLSYGDAVGNDTIAIQNLLCEMGYETRIYAENIDPRLPNGLAAPVSGMPELSPDDIIIYHGSTGTDLNERLPHLTGRKVMIYHNITPPGFFAPYSPAAQQLTADGLQGIRGLADRLESCIADSEFNKQDLLRMGFTCPIDVCPILIPFSDYEKEPNAQLLGKYGGDGYTNLLFVGRIAPNKCQEDILRAFCCYQKCYNPKSRLILAGSWSGMECYYDRLCVYARLLGIEDQVIFTGHIKFDELLAWYHLANVFVCMSEHEGFCVPLVEAMYFDVPIVAYASTAIPNTLGGSGVLLDTKTPNIVADAIHHIINDEEHRAALLSGQRDRLQDFQYGPTASRLKDLLSNLLHQQPGVRRPRIVQLSATISRGDAVSNDIMAFYHAFLNMGYPTKIYTETMPAGRGWEAVDSVERLPMLSAQDIAIYHHATGTSLARLFAHLPCKKVMVYHNVTPPSFFAPYDRSAAQSCQRGLDNLSEMRGYVDRCIADSTFNKQDLVRAGYTCPIDVCPILIPFKDYDRSPDLKTIQATQDGSTNVIFVGRVAPNKKFEDRFCFPSI